MKISGIIFDKDGTLMDFNKFWVPAVQSVIRRIFADYGIPETDIFLEKALNSIGVVHGKVLSSGSFAWKPYCDIALDLKPSLESMTGEKVIDASELAKKLVRYFEEASYDDNKVIAPTADLQSVMQLLQSNNIHLGVVTTDTYKATVECLKRLQIEQYITFLAADLMPYAENSEPMPLKPDGRIISRAVKQWRIKPEEVLVVGDTPNDMKFAHNGGSVAVGVLSGVSSKEQLQPSADYILDSVSEIPDLICKLGQEGR